MNRDFPINLKNILVIKKLKLLINIKNNVHILFFYSITNYLTIICFKQILI